MATIVPFRAAFEAEACRVEFGAGMDEAVTRLLTDTLHALGHGTYAIKGMAGDQAEALLDEL